MTTRFLAQVVNLHSQPACFNVVRFLFRQFTDLLLNCFLQCLHTCWDIGEVETLVQINNPMVIWASNIITPGHISLAQSSISRAQVVQPAKNI